MDTVSPDVRSRTMRAVRGRDTGLELRLRAALRARGLRGYRVGPSDVPGHPDIAYPGLRLAVFIDGCFWHGCPEHCRRPSSNTSYWNQKLDRNIARDVETRGRLIEGGWRVERIWEHEITRDLEQAAARVAATVQAVKEQRASYRAHSGRL